MAKDPTYFHDLYQQKKRIAAMEGTVARPAGRPSKTAAVSEPELSSVSDLQEPAVSVKRPDTLSA